MNIEVIIWITTTVGLALMMYAAGWFAGRRWGRIQRMAVYDRQVKISVDSSINARRQVAFFKGEAKRWQSLFYTKEVAFDKLAEMVVKMLTRIARAGRDDISE